MPFVELQCEGLPGPTHHYAGLSHGNVASARHAGVVSHPRQAALQALEKMGRVAALGVPVAIVPPPPRPNLALLAALGIAGENPASLLAEAAAIAPRLLSAAATSAAMWTANMATASPAPDTVDAQLHLTPANLVSTLHRHQEATESTAYLRRLFAACPEVMVHDPLPPATPLADEGAANHMRLCGGLESPGVEVFVYGIGEARGEGPLRFPARQTRSACEALARRHRLPPERAVFVQQHPAAIDAGVFHNDVIAMSHLNLLIYHAQAFQDEERFLAELRQKLAPTPLQAVRIEEADLALEEAVATYFFNSQLLSLPDGTIAVFAPAECETHINARTLFDRLIQAENPIARVDYLNVRQSMQNGGGPACLRLRIPLDASFLPRFPKRCLYSEETAAVLHVLITENYPETLEVSHLADAHFAAQALATSQKISNFLFSDS